ncbi:MAG: urea ABC transporter substrate-binding protein [Pseudoxanthomonas sp.]|nr:urea ABC transporter substrate-binding protein [Pseudoxanthomonas sp.]
MAQTPPTAQVNTTRLAVTDSEVVVGQLHSSTGTMAISETGSIQAEQLAIDQINAAGGILGRKIRVIKEDGASDWPTFAEKSRKLLINDRVAAVFGCWTSASRKAVLPIFEKENGLLYYPTFYEGLEQSKNVIYTGQEATQQILWGLDWAKKEKNVGKVFLVGSDYIWPRTAMKIARKHIENIQKGKVVGEEYYPLGNTNFNSLINKIKVAKPDLIFAAVVGGSNVAFYKQLKAAGITGDKQFLLTLSVTEDEMLGIGGENFAGFYSSMKYFQSLDNPNNKKFVEAFKAKYGPKSVIGDVTQAGYLGPWLWKMAVEKAGSFDVAKVTAASPGIELKTAPEGYVKIDANHHLWSKARIGQGQPDGTFKVVAESADLIKPDPFPKGYQ